MTAVTKAQMIFTFCRSKTISMSSFLEQWNHCIIVLVGSEVGKEGGSEELLSLVQIIQQCSVVNSYTEISTTAVNKVEAVAATITEELVRHMSSTCAVGKSTVTVGGPCNGSGLPVSARCS